MATILDVERESGVSKSTISRYLNGKNVTESNKIKIVSAIKKLDYKINPIASGLKNNKTFSVGVMIPNVNDAFFPPVIKSCEEYLNFKGYSTLLCNYSRDLKIEKKKLEFLVEKRVDGIILASCAHNGEHIEPIIEKGIPITLIDRYIPNVVCDSIVVDNMRASYNAIVLAIQKGHKKIAIINGPENLYTARERYKGYLQALKDFNIEKNDEYIIFGKYGRESGKKGFLQLLNLKDKPTIIFVANIFSTLGVLEAVLEYKIKIPNDVSIISFDDIIDNPLLKFAAAIKPNFSSIRQPLETIGKRAAEMMVRRIEENSITELVPEVIELKSTLQITDSIKSLI